ncbi:hypothetical protein KQX54_005963 [Cotesia glomerata]|uniref:CHK kinase-like domain-containing protein n=3 Tax=Cotesia glomerata TaxID=32391 RepID=A0AAV7IHX3_COTGL|nr:hypothetical protein KQX54_005963 [Cotesia glomerata]
MSELEWLTEEFVQNALRNAKKDNSILVTNMVVKNATDKGDNYTSEMYRVYFDLTCKDGKKKCSVIVKTTHRNQGKHTELIESADLFGIEMTMMTSTLREMESVLKDTKLGGLCYFTRPKDPKVLMIEDLAPLGFKMANRQTGLDFNHCTLALQGLAKFHASSVLIIEKNPELKEIYSKGMFEMEFPEDMSNFFVSGMKYLVKAAASWPELREDCRKKIEKIANVAYDKAANARKLDEKEFNVINHGDFWVNNMMFKYNDKGDAVDHIFVDFQLCSYTTPALDLLYFLNSSASEEVLENHRSSLIKGYVKTLSETMTRIGCKTKAPSIEYFKKILADKAIIGFVIACSGLPILKLDKSKAQGLEEMMNNKEDFHLMAYNNEAYRKVIVPRLHEWDSQGLFDK